MISKVYKNLQMKGSKANEKSGRNQSKETICVNSHIAAYFEAPRHLHFFNMFFYPLNLKLFF